MKKTFLALLFLILTFGLSAETGYDGTKWNENKNKINFGEAGESWEISKDKEVVYFSTIILGKREIECYILILLSLNQHKQNILS